MNERERRQEWAHVFSALASEHRLRLVELLSDESIRCQEEMQDHLQLSQPAISYHLSKLEQAGVLLKERQGTRNCYRVREGVGELVRLISKEGEDPWIER